MSCHLYREPLLVMVYEVVFIMFVMSVIGTEVEMCLGNSSRLDERVWWS